MNKRIIITRLSSLENTFKNKERFNPYVSGYGVHRSKKYPIRAEIKRNTRKEVEKYRLC